MIRARVVGLDKLRARFRRVQGAGAVAMGDGVAAGAREIQSEARQRVPRRSGRLARSISVEMPPDGLAATVGTDLDHGMYLEFGTRHRPARPWLHPAFMTVLPSLRAGFVRAARAALRQP